MVKGMPATALLEVSVTINRSTPTGEGCAVSNTQRRRSRVIKGGNKAGERAGVPRGVKANDAKIVSARGQA